MFVKHCKVEVYLVEFLLADNRKPEETVKKKFSKSDTVATIAKEMKAIFNLADEAEFRLWTKYSATTYEQLAKLDNPVTDAGLYSGQVLLIETKNEDGSWPRQVTKYVKISIKLDSLFISFLYFALQY